MPQVDSTAISYSAERGGELSIQFTDGSLYTYRDVPREVYEDLISASSVGGYFNREIRPRYLNYTRHR